MAIADKKKKNNAPDIRRERRNILNEKTPFSIVEEYKLLRTNIMFSLAKDGCRKVAFTSANMSEGKSISAINTEEDVKQVTLLPIIGSISDFDQVGHGGYYGYGYGSRKSSGGTDNSVSE